MNDYERAPGNEYVKVKVKAVRREQFDTVVLLTRADLTAIQFGRAGLMAAQDGPLPTLLGMSVPDSYLDYEDVSISEYVGPEKPSRIADFETSF